MTIVWLEEYRGGFDWDDSSRTGNVGMFNVGVEFTCVLSESTPADASTETQNRIRSAILSPNS